MFPKFFSLQIVIRISYYSLLIIHQKTSLDLQSFQKMILQKTFCALQRVSVRDFIINIFEKILFYLRIQLEAAEFFHGMLAQAEVFHSFVVADEA